MLKRIQVPWHPALFAVYPLLLIFASNRGVLLWPQVAGCMGISLAVAVGIFVVLALLTRRVNFSALLSAGLVLVFFSYGELLEEVDGKDVWALLIALVLWLGLAVVAWRFSEKLAGLTRWLNWVSVLLLILVGIQIGTTPLAHVPRDGTYPVLEGLEWPADPEVKPNIYYLVLDAYARADVLEELYAYDNSGMLSYLKEQGFQVVDKARSNYGQSIFSLASSLNMEMLDRIAEQVDKNSHDHTPLTAMLRDNAVFAFLRHYGYTILGFDAAGWETVEVESTDVFYPTPGRGMDSVTTALANTTLLGAWQRLRHEGTELSEHAMHRLRITHALDKLEEVPAIHEGPFMAYAHILLPHQPFVFFVDGSPANEDQPFTIWHTTDRGRDSEEYRRNYVAQLAYANLRTKQLIEKIVANESRPSVIIIQADHGPALELHTRDASRTNFKERLSILTAGRFPGVELELPSDQTPVNTFRMLFNSYFGTSFEILPQDSFFGTWNRPYQFIPYAPED